MTSYRLKRSLLYSPASRIDRVRKALEKGEADVVVADLEDGTAPSERPAAREAVKALLLDPPRSRTALAVRINALGTPDAKEDWKAIARRTPAIVVVPKVESPRDLGSFSTALARARKDATIFAQVETARGLLESARTAAVSRVEALIFGSEDYAASVGAIRTPEGTEILYARSHVVTAASAAGIDAIDQIWPDYKDLDGLRRDAVFGARLGYAGKQLIHPDQIAPTHVAFAPSPAEVDRAQRIVAGADAANGGVAVVDGRMIDRPLVEQARRVLRRANPRPGI